jgi:hypothetical protein
VRLLAVLRIVRVATTDLCAGQNAVDTAQNTLTARDEIREVADTMSQRLEAMVGRAHTTSVALGLAPTQIDALLRALRLLIDGGARGMADASLGTANLILCLSRALSLIGWSRMEIATIRSSPSRSWFTVGAASNATRARHKCT